MSQRYWMSPVEEFDSFNRLINGEFIDGRLGPQTGSVAWAIFTPDSWKHFGCGKLGTGYGQRYVQDAEGRWPKVEG